MKEKFDVLIIFIDGTQLIAPNVLNFATDNTKPDWCLTHDNHHDTYVSKSQVRLIGRKKDLEGCV